MASKRKNLNAPVAIGDVFKLKRGLSVFGNYHGGVAKCIVYLEAGSCGYVTNISFHDDDSYPRRWYVTLRFGSNVSVRFDWSEYNIEKTLEPAHPLEQLALQTSVPTRPDDRELPQILKTLGYDYVKNRFFPKTMQVRCSGEKDFVTFPRGTISFPYNGVSSLEFASPDMVWTWLRDTGQFSD